MHVRDKVARTRRRMATGVAAAGLAVLALTGGGVAIAAPAEVAADC